MEADTTESQIVVNPKDWSVYQNPPLALTALMALMLWRCPEVATTGVWPFKP
jgi:hypothetical protein